MQIALVGPVYPYRGGIAHYTMQLYEALVQRGHNVAVISFKRQYPHWLYPGKSDQDPSSRPVLTVPAEYLVDTLWPPSWLKTVHRISRVQPDVVIMQWWTTFLAPAWFGIGMAIRLWIRHTRLVYICHNVLPHETRAWDKWVTQAVLRWGHVFLVQSEQERERFEQLLPGKRVIVVPPPAFLLFTNGVPSKPAARQTLGLSDRATVLLFFGIVRPYKGLEDLLLALPFIVKHDPSVVLLVAGEFWEPERKYRDLVSRLGMQDHVYIENRYVPDEEVPYYFAAADLFVAPYRSVTGSASIQVARGFGLPVFDRTTWRCQAQTPEGLAACILSALHGQASPETSTSTWEGLVEVIEGNA